MVQLTQRKTADALTDRADVIDIEPLDAAKVLPGVRRSKNRIAGCVSEEKLGTPKPRFGPRMAVMERVSERLFLAGFCPYVSLHKTAVYWHHGLELRQ